MKLELRRRVFVALGACLSLTCPSFAQQDGYWKAEVRMSDYGFGIIKKYVPDGTGRIPGRMVSAYPGGSVNNYRYAVFQAPDGVLRRELAWTDIGRQGILAPMGVALIDIREGYKLVYDKGGSKADRSGFRSVGKPTPLPPMILLQHHCRGQQYQWTDRQGELVRVKEWAMTDGDFKPPLLQFVYQFDSSGALRGLTTVVVTSLQTPPSLPQSLFEPPPGLQIENGPPAPLPLWLVF